MMQINEKVSNGGIQGHRVETSFCRAKRFRRINTRYDELPGTYIGFVKIWALTKWIDFDFFHAA